MFKKYNINGIELPIIDTKIESKEGYIYITQGIICMEIPEKCKKTIEEIIEKNKDLIFEIYTKNEKKKIINRSEEEFNELIMKYFDKYTKKLNVKPKQIYIAPLNMRHLALAYNDYDIEINSYMKYMEEEVIQLTIYHELCHLYTLKYNNTFTHNEDFHNILYKEFTKKEEKRIMGINS